MQETAWNSSDETVRHCRRRGERCGTCLLTWRPIPRRFFSPTWGKEKKAIFRVFFFTVNEKVKDRPTRSRYRERVYDASVSREFMCYVNPCMVPRARVDQLTAVVFITPSRFKAEGGRPSRRWPTSSRSIPKIRGAEPASSPRGGQIRGKRGGIAREMELNRDSRVA